MSFTGVEFLLFFPVVLAVHWLLPRRTVWQNAFVLLASYVFYYSWSPRLLAVLLVSTAFDFLVGRAMASRRGSARLFLGASVVFNVGLLGYYKYEGFFAQSFNALLSHAGLGAPLPVLAIVMPVGISYYTFQKLAYVIDVYYERIPPCRDPLTFATFVAFFPQIVAGPITRGGELLPQFSAPRTLDADRVRAGAASFLSGLFKKIFVAEFLSRSLVEQIWSAPDQYSIAGHWLGLLAYGFQIYCDFAGYSEMAIGAGRLLGVELPVNFDLPFLSKGMLEFWRRWHITLNQWLFDYLYGPMTTGESFLRGRMRIGFLIVFALSGLWHGARWTFVAWGAIHGVALAVQYSWDLYYKSLCRRDRRYVALRKSVGYSTAAWALTQGFFLLSLVPFRAPTLGTSAQFLRGLFVPHAGRFWPAYAPHLRTPLVLICFAYVVGTHVLAWDSLRPLRERFLALPAPARGVVYGVVIVFLLILAPPAAGTFIYGNF